MKKYCEIAGFKSREDTRGVGCNLTTAQVADFDVDALFDKMMELSTRGTLEVKSISISESRSWFVVHSNSPIQEHELSFLHGLFSGLINGQGGLA